VDIHDGLGGHEPFWSQAVLQRIPGDVRALLASDQVRHRPVRVELIPLPQTLTHAALLVLLALAGGACYVVGRPQIAFLTAALVFFLAANALVIGFGSTPHGRYQGRVAWLVPHGLALAAWAVVDRKPRPR
jgi:hypothetical protein